MDFPLFPQFSLLDFPQFSNFSQFLTVVFSFPYLFFSLSGVFPLFRDVLPFFPQLSQIFPGFPSFSKDAQASNWAMYWLLNERQRRPDNAAFRRRHGSAAASTAASTGERNERGDAQ